jgi:hypothetical protein
MAINIPIITSLEDTGIKSAKAAFGDFKNAVSKAEGGMGKFKAGSKVAMDQVKANAGNLAMVAGAIAGFAIKAVGDFQDLAIAAGKFAVMPQVCTLRMHPLYGSSRGSKYSNTRRRNCYWQTK